MGLRTKFNLVILAVFIVGILGTGIVSYEVLQRNAREEILNTAGIIMQSAIAVRAYTVQEIRPLLSVQIKRDFLPQTVPAYAATTNIRNLRKKYPEYTYKEATLNPTNPASRATDWETTIVDYFRNNQDKQDIVGEHDTATGPMLYMARPIQINDPNCLTCHGKVDDAPETMLTRYGRANGFGWKMNEVVGAQIVNVPMALPLARADKTFITFMAALTAVFAGVFIILNLLLQYIVIQPVKQISAIAHDVSMGKMDVEECDARGNDEISSLAQSFNRMRRSLINALEMLGE
jgi:HAMP domain-containing protein